MQLYLQIRRVTDNLCELFMSNGIRVYVCVCVWRGGFAVHETPLKQTKKQMRLYIWDNSSTLAVLMMLVSKTVLR